MAYAFFYISIAAVWVALIVITYGFRPAGLRHWIIAIVTAVISLAYDIILGTQMRLYYYIDPAISNICMVLSGLFLYPPLNVIFSLYLPEARSKVFLYTLIWIGAMLAFEFAGVYTGTLVFTGWRAMPCSVVTYAFTYAWVILLYRYLGKFKNYQLT